MLQQLRVLHFAIIDDICLNFEPGFNVITGETGSGKSLLVKVFSLLMGEKTSSHLIREGASYAQIEGVFSIEYRDDIKEKLTQMGLQNCEQEDVLIIRRQIYPDKGKIFINDHQTTLQTLKDVVFPLVDVTSRSAPLIEITGQFDNKNLLAKEFHLELLDSFAGLDELKSTYQALYNDYLKTQNELKIFQQKNQDKIYKQDFLLFQKKEIESVSPRENEDQLLEQEIKELKDFAKILDFYKTCQNLLVESPQSSLSQLQMIVKKFYHLKINNDFLSLWINRLEHLINELSEMSFELSQIASNNEDHWTEDLDKKMERLSLIRKLQKKFGPTINDILSHYRQIELELSQLQNFEQIEQKLKDTMENQTHQLIKLATHLHQERINFSKKLEEQVNIHLNDLNMKGVSFSVSISESLHLSVQGKSLVEFKVLQHGQTDPKSLCKVASGGELSRILLALKVVALKEKWPRTYLFDEVDAGLSGVTAEKVGRKLRQVAHSCGQVICVTHLPQVSVFADHHYVIEKELNLEKQKPIVTAFKLDFEGRKKEVARLLSGEKITSFSIKNAEDLLNQASKEGSLSYFGM